MAVQKQQWSRIKINMYMAASLLVAAIIGYVGLHLLFWYLNRKRGEVKQTG